MIFSAILFALQAAQTAQPQPVPEIVVIGNLRSIAVSVGQDGEGSWHCSLDRSTGRARLDDRLCRAVTDCVREGASDDAAVSACIREERARLIRRIERSMQRDS